MLFFCLYILIGYSLKICFFVFGENRLYDYLDYLCDIFFLIDIIVIFFQPVIDRKKYCVTFRKIAAEYLMFWFWVDFASSIPFGLVLGQEENPDLSTTRFRAIFEVPRLYKILRLLKLLKISRLFRYKSRAILLASLKRF